MNSVEVCPKCERMTLHVGDSNCVCASCAYSLSTEEYWKTTVNNLRERGYKMHFGVYVCIVCGEAFALVDELTEHRDEKHKAMPVATGT